MTDFDPATSGLGRGLKLGGCIEGLLRDEADGRTGTGGGAGPGRGLVEKAGDVGAQVDERGVLVIAGDVGVQVEPEPLDAIFVRAVRRQEMQRDPRQASQSSQRYLAAVDAVVVQDEVDVLG